MKTENRYSPYGAAYNKPDTIIVHAMGEYVFTGNGDEIAYAPDFLADQGLSAHALVSPEGTVYRCRSDDQGAYHARGFNRNSLGIEIMIRGRYDHISLKREMESKYIQPAQYDALVEQCKEWINLHDIKNVLRHSDVSPERKYDPGRGLDWDKFLTDIGWK